MRTAALIFTAIFFSFYACSGNKQDDISHRNSNDLQQKSVDSYKPGLGQFMSGIQAHHAKLWFAGINKNWKLADYEIGEIMESFDDVKKYCSDRDEVKFLYLIDPALDTLSHAIRAQDTLRFRSGFTFLTNTCNNCHRSVNYGFNVVKIPASPPFSNQDFTPSK
ncbi:MAG TPA: hypothetical protein VI112_00985 [Bacteroidia bacterium]|jgi:hypothetical protein